MTGNIMENYIHVYNSNLLLTQKPIQLMYQLRKQQEIIVA